MKRLFKSRFDTLRESIEYYTPDILLVFFCIILMCAYGAFGHG